MKFDPAAIASQLAAVTDGDVELDVPLAPLSSYKIGGSTSVWVAPATEQAVGRVLELIYQKRLPLFVLGRGSNILISDKGWNGVTLYLGENLSALTFDGLDASVLAGTLLIDLIQAAIQKGLAGLEQLSGIPGGIGGALRMNAGAFGQEIEHATLTVNGFRNDGSPFQAARKDIKFKYRRVPQLADVVITSAVFGFEKSDRHILSARMKDILSLRAKKQPLKYPSCGSVFKRPAGYYAGALIEEAGLKGERIGGAMISPKHAGFILNVDRASAADVYALINLVENKIYDRFGVRLEREVRLIGEFD
ncbi:MAG: UDP-N-acetylmuramate dehydrogenase [Deltaproteobacteria bacterium]|nr:UDP-N-acetylmuramate dehydrogenase [Deltaproteobacteria bacterium]